MGSGEVGKGQESADRGQSSGDSGRSVVGSCRGRKTEISGGWACLLGSINFAEAFRTRGTWKDTTVPTEESEAVTVLLPGVKPRRYTST